MFSSLVSSQLRLLFIFFFNDTATTEIYTLSLHDALPISPTYRHQGPGTGTAPTRRSVRRSGVRVRHASAGSCGTPRADRKSTRLNSSHANISYAVFCLKKKINGVVPFAITSPNRAEPTIT